MKAKTNGAHTLTPYSRGGGAVRSTANFLANNGPRKSIFHYGVKIDRPSDSRGRRGVDDGEASFEAKSRIETSPAAKLKLSVTLFMLVDVGRRASTLGFPQAPATS